LYNGSYESSLSSAGMFFKEIGEKETAYFVTDISIKSL
jgi:hypothetical protein